MFLKVVSSAKHGNGFIHYSYKGCRASLISLLMKKASINNNMSIMEGIFSSCLKTGRVIPILKSGKKDQTTNYRTLSTLPI